MTDTANATPEAQRQVAPTGFKFVPTSFSFRRFPDTQENRDKQVNLKTADHPIEVDQEKELDDNGKETGKLIFKRKTENYDLLVPTLASLGIVTTEGDAASEQQAVVLDSLITDAIVKEGRKLVNEGKVVTPDNCNWEVAVKSLYESITAGGAKFSKELLEEVCDSFTKYMQAINKPQEGIDATVKMIKNRFGAMSVRKYLVALPAIQQNIESWLTDGLTAEEQEIYLPVTEYLIERIKIAQEPPKPVDVGAMF